MCVTHCLTCEPDQEEREEEEDEKEEEPMTSGSSGGAGGDDGGGDIAGGADDDDDADNDDEGDSDSDNMIGDEEAWVVSDILKEQYDGVELQYLISGENCDESENSWEPAVGIDAPSILAAFHSSSQYVPTKKLVQRCKRAQKASRKKRH
jgi:hypothetical protein